jgi:hypothetical protein
MPNAACQITAALAAFYTIFMQIGGERKRLHQPSTPVNGEVSLNED